MNGIDNYGNFKTTQKFNNHQKAKKQKLAEKSSQRKALMEALEDPANKIKTDGNFEEFRKSANEYLGKVISALDEIIKKRHFYSDSLSYFKGIRKNLNGIKKCYNDVDFGRSEDLCNDFSKICKKWIKLNSKMFLLLIKN